MCREGVWLFLTRGMWPRVRGGARDEKTAVKNIRGTADHVRELPLRTRDGRSIWQEMMEFVDRWADLDDDEAAGTVVVGQGRR